METVIQQPFGHIERGDSGRLVFQSVKDKLMLAAGVNRKFEAVFQFLFDIIGIQSSQRTYLLYVLPPQSQDIGVSTHQHAEVTHKSRDASGSGIITFNGVMSVLLAHYLRIRQIFDQMCCDSYRSGARATATVRCGEGLVQIQVQDVKSHISRPGHTHKRIHIGPVVIEQSSTIVHQLGNFKNLRFKQSQCVRIGHHDARNRIVQQRTQILHIDSTLWCGLHLHHLKSANRRAGRVGTMGTVGHDYLRAFAVATLQVILPHDHQSGKLAMSSGKRIQRKLCHTGNGR